MRTARQQDACAIDAVQQVKANVGLARQVQRLADQRTGVVEPAPVQGHFGEPLRRESLAGGRTNRMVQTHALRQVLLGRCQVAGEQFRLAADRDAEGVPACGAEPLRFGRQPFGKRDDLRIGPRAVQEALQDAQLAVEHTHGQMRQLAGVVQVGPDALVQFPAGMRRRRLGPRRGHPAPRCHRPAMPAGVPRPPSACPSPGRWRRGPRRRCRSALRTAVLRRWSGARRPAPAAHPYEGRHRCVELTAVCPYWHNDVDVEAEPQAAEVGWFRQT